MFIEHRVITHIKCQIENKQDLSIGHEQWLVIHREQLDQRMTW